MGQALYRKYRSKSFGDVIGQDHITKTLSNAIKSGKISHAYLLTGPKGVGKTTIARILAHEVNNLPYTDESVHLDIIEIDAASNRRIDEIRDLRDKVRIAPAAAKYKVYIIDEVHMLTREAFNALLKTLEEPPAHCIFILATTEAHKLPDTIISRTQRFEFKPIAGSQAADHLAQIAKNEKIIIDREALELLAEYGGGSFRDSISYLDQLSSYGNKITADDVRSLLGLPAATEIEKLLKYLEAADTPLALQTLNQIEQTGVSAPAIAAGIAGLIRDKAISSQLSGWEVGLLSSLLTVSASHRPKDALEIALLSSTPISNRVITPEPATPNPKKSALAAVAPATDQITEELPPKPAVVQPTNHSNDFNLDRWDEIISASKQKDASIYTALRLAQPSYQNNILTLSFQFPLHQKKLNLAKNKNLLSELIQEICGVSLKVETVVDKSQLADKIEKPQPTTPIDAIGNIFGGAEVLEA